MPESHEEPAPGAPFQFGIRDLLLLTTAVALACSLAATDGLGLAFFALGIGLLMWWASRLMRESPDDFVVVWKGHAIDAAQLRAAELPRHGIRAIAQDGELSGLPGLPVDSARVLVLGRDADRARQVLGAPPET